MLFSCYFKFLPLLLRPLRIPNSLALFRYCEVLKKVNDQMKIGALEWLNFNIIVSWSQFFDRVLNKKLFYHQGPPGGMARGRGGPGRGGPGRGGPGRGVRPQGMMNAPRMGPGPGGPGMMPPRGPPPMGGPRPGGPRGPPVGPGMRPNVVSSCFKLYSTFLYSFLFNPLVGESLLEEWNVSEKKEEGEWFLIIQAQMQSS